MAEPLKVFNPRRGEYGVTVTIGPSYATKRIEAQEQLAAFIGKVPEPMRGVAAALMAKYSDWPGSTELFKALAKMLPAGVLAPDQGDMPPAIAAMVSGMTQQIQKLMVERMQLLRELSERKVDQALAREKIDKYFTAKLLAIAEKAQKHADEMSVKAVDQTLAAAQMIEKSLTQGAGPRGGNGGMPPQ